MFTTIAAVHCAFMWDAAGADAAARMTTIAMGRVPATFRVPGGRRRGAAGMMHSMCIVSTRQVRERMSRIESSLAAEIGDDQEDVMRHFCAA